MKYLLFFMLPVVLFLGCAPKPVVEPVVVEEPIPEPVILPKFTFTSAMIKELNLTSQQICDLQFYVSHDIKLQKTIPAQTANITDGTLVVSKQDKIHTIIIKAGTPGVAIEAKNNMIIVKFKENFELTFMHSNNKKDLFLLTANKWKKGIGSLLVDGKMYQAVGKSGQAHLEINKTDVDNTDNNSLTLDGELLN